MPMITAQIGKKLTEEEAIRLKSGLGEIIALIPGKSESVLMIDLCDGHNMFFKGEKTQAAYLDVRLYTKAPFEAKAAFAAAAAELLEEVGIQRQDTYLTFTEFENWGMRGTLK